MLFRARQFEFRFPRPALVMGIVNVTPDSFSDGGRFLDTDAAVAHALELVEQGADILDIGGESTRPGAEPISEDEELSRVIPVIEKLSAALLQRWGECPHEPNDFSSQTMARGDTRPTESVLVSIDTVKPAVARAALEAGAVIVNDVAANSRCLSTNHHQPSTPDPMWSLVAEFQAGYICMHAQGDPQTMQKNPVYNDVVHDVNVFFGERLQRLEACGVAPERVALDVGIGFGKTAEHNLQLLGNLRSFTKWNRPLLLGVSRKSFLGKFSGAAMNERLPASLACATLAIESGVQMVRVHDVRETVRAVRMAEAVIARRKSDGISL